jgi:hypothetical protein
LVDKSRAFVRQEQGSAWWIGAGISLVGAKGFCMCGSGSGNLIASKQDQELQRIINSNWLSER